MRTHAGHSSSLLKEELLRSERQSEKIISRVDPLPTALAGVLLRFMLTFKGRILPSVTLPAIEVPYTKLLEGGKSASARERATVAGSHHSIRGGMSRDLGYVLHASGPLHRTSYQRQHSSCKCRLAAGAPGYLTRNIPEPAVAPPKPLDEESAEAPGSSQWNPGFRDKPPGPRPWQKGSTVLRPGSGPSIGQLTDASRTQDGRHLPYTRRFRGSAPWRPAAGQTSSRIWLPAPRGPGRRDDHYRDLLMPG